MIQAAHNAAHSHDDHDHAHAAPPTFSVRVLRQDAPDQPSYWEKHTIVRENDMNVISVLQRIAAQAETSDGAPVTPVAWDCNCLEEVCGACTMVINGKVRQACSALVDKLLVDNPEEIELRPMSKFPVVRDLVVNRGRLFRALQRAKAWIPVDGYYDLGTGPRVAPADQEVAYPLSECMSCGCCLEACPQYVKIEMTKQEGETEEAFRARERAAYDTSFIGAHAISQIMLFNGHPTGKMQAAERLDALTGPGGIQDCGNAQNCVAVCPKKIPLTTSIGRAGRATTIHSLKKFFDR
jgi:succinate dehydrogenase / fumarate reductase iron-sulfur subunit